ncbi:MAG: PAS domain S-box protein, partial [Fidelibacterota bacterium]
MVTPPQISQFIVRSNPEAIYVIRNDGRIVDANEACSKMLGYSRDELLRLTVHDVSPRFTKRDWPNGWRMLKRRKSGILEGEHRAKDGHLIPVEITAIHLVSNGNEYVCAFAREITRRKKAEKSARESRQLIETIYDTIPEAVITTDLNYTVVSCNKSVLNVLGYSPDELVGKNYSTFVQKGMFEGPDREKRKTELFESGHLDQEEFLFQKKNGETFTGSFSVAMISDSEGKPAGLVGTIRDITRKKRADREIRGHAKRSAAIREASEALVASLDFATVVNKCATIAKDLIHADGVAIFLKNSEGTHLEPVISKGSYGTEVLSVKLKIGEGVSGSVA